MTDLVKRLRDMAPMLSPSCGWSIEERSLPSEAAARIEQLEAALTFAAQKTVRQIAERDTRIEQLEKRDDEISYLNANLNVQDSQQRKRIEQLEDELFLAKQEAQNYKHALWSLQENVHAPQMANAETRIEQLEAAVALAYEDAARIAEGNPSFDVGDRYDGTGPDQWEGRAAAADAIRAKAKSITARLKQAPHSNSQDTGDSKQSRSDRESETT